MEEVKSWMILAMVFDDKPRERTCYGAFVQKTH